MQRIHTEIENAHISQVTPKLFNVQIRGQVYQVWLGSEDQLPSCQCMDYRIRKLPCKHICAVVQQPSVGWESLGSRFNTHPLFTLDQEVTQSQPEDTKLPAEVADCPSTPPQNKERPEGFLGTQRVPKFLCACVSSAIFLASHSQPVI